MGSNCDYDCNSRGYNTDGYKNVLEKLTPSTFLKVFNNDVINSNHLV